MSEINLNGFITTGQYTELLSKINEDTSTRRARLQCALRHAAYHAALHRNADPAIRLFAVVGRETNVRGMAKWLEANAPIAFKEGVAFFHEKKWKTNYATATGVEIECELMEALPFWRVKDAATEIQDTQLDVLDELRAVLTRISNQAKVNAMTADKRGKRKVKTILHGEIADQVAAILNQAQYA